MAHLKPEFDKRNTKIIGLSVDPVEKHAAGRRTSKKRGMRRTTRMIGDTISRSRRHGACCRRRSTARARPHGRRQPDGSQRLRRRPTRRSLMIVHPMTTGRNFDEVLRVLDSLQLTAKYKVSTPVNWKAGDDVISAGSVSDEDAKKTYPQGWRAPRPYIRIVPQPGAVKKVRYRKDGIAIFDATTEEIFSYMSAGNHPHAAFKSHRLVSLAGNVVTIEAEVHNPDGTTFKTTITHRLNPPVGIETTMSGGPFDGAKFTHSYTSLGDRTKVDLQDEFPALPGMSEADELKMIDGFFGGVFAEDMATLHARV